MKKAALHSLGCKVNLYETEAMQQMLEQAGYEIVPFHDRADVYIINTCSVTNIADRKSRQMIHKAKKMNPDAIVVAAGCYVQTSTEQAKADAAIDIIIGNNKKQDLLAMLEAYEADHGVEQEGVLDINHTKQEYEELTVIHPSEHTRAFLKVQDGCNQFCSYCIIPYARGRVRSRKLEDVAVEARRLAENGFQELVLTGIHLSSYGIDCDSSLLELIQTLHEIDGIERIRLGSLEPGIITESFVQALVKLPKVCPHFHLSLQSGSGTVLKRMNRRYTPEEYLEKCDLLRQYYEHPAITTDIIVGFPGETPEEFEETCAFVKKVDFYEVHVFKYSKRNGTVAASMPDQIDEETKLNWQEELMELQQEIAFDRAEGRTGSVVTAMIEGKVADEDAYVARTYGDAPNVDGLLFVQTAEELNSGDFVRVRITGAVEYDLIGELTEDI